MTDTKDATVMDDYLKRRKRLRIFASIGLGAAIYLSLAAILANSHAFLDLQDCAAFESVSSDWTLTSFDTYIYIPWGVGYYNIFDAFRLPGFYLQLIAHIILYGSCYIIVLISPKIIIKRSWIANGTIILLSLISQILSALYFFLIFIAREKDQSFARGDGGVVTTIDGVEMCDAGGFGLDIYVAAAIAVLTIHFLWLLREERFD